MTTAQRHHSADELMATGLRNRWYAVCPSHFVAPGSLRRLTRLGEDWVLFREPDGTPHMLADRCPHRGARLSQGTHLGDRIACAYHGVQTNGEGVVVSVPGLPGCKLEGKQAAVSLPLREAAGAVFGYFGDDQHAEPPDFSCPDPLTDAGMSFFLCYAEWNAVWRYAMENLLDPMHGIFLHRESHTLSGGAITARLRVRETDRGFFVEKTEQSGKNFDRVEFCDTGADWIYIEVPYPPSAGPGGPFYIVGMATPLTATATAVFFWRCRQVTGWKRDVWRFLYKVKIESRHWDVLEQDRAMLEGMPGDADQFEHLYQHDLGISGWRRRIRREAEGQSACTGVNAGTTAGTEVG